MIPKGEAKKVSIYLNQDTRSGIEPVWAAILEFLRHKHVSGASLFRADAGFGSHEVLHDPQSEYRGDHRPLRIEFIETGDKVDALLPALDEMVCDGLIVVQDVTVVKSTAKDAARTR